MKNFLRSNWVLLAILGLAIFFRFWQINHLPGGLFPDEAINGLDAHAILSGNIQPFYESNNGREGLFFYFIALSIAMFGSGVWQIHIIPAIFGVLSVLAGYFLANRMFGKRVALLASFFMATSSYAVALSHTAFRANMVPLFSTLTLLFLVKFFQVKTTKEKLISAFTAGASFGLGFYTYISFRMMIPFIFILTLLLLVSFRHKLKALFLEHVKYKTAFGFGFLLTAAWIAWYFIVHPQSFIGRAGQVSIFASEYNNGDPLGTFFVVFAKTLLGFFTIGDSNFRHNVAGYPFLSPFLSPFFGLAVAWFSWHALKLVKDAKQKLVNVQTWHYASLALLFWLMLVPEVTTAEGIPHGLRLIGVIPVIFIMSAWGIDQAWQRIAPAYFFAYSRTAFAAIFLSSIFLYNFHAYFIVAPNSPEYYNAYRADLTETSNYLNSRNQKEKTYLSLDSFSAETVKFLTFDYGQPYVQVSPERTYQLQLTAGDQVVFTQSTVFDRTKFVQAHPQAKLVKELRNQWNQTVMLVYEQP